MVVVIFVQRLTIWTKLKSKIGKSVIEEKKSVLFLEQMKVKLSMFLRGF